MKAPTRSFHRAGKSRPNDLWASVAEGTTVLATGKSRVVGHRKEKPMGDHVGEFEPQSNEAPLNNQCLALSITSLNQAS